MPADSATRKPVRPHLERYASLDVGTNSVLMLIAERGPGGRLRPLADRACITRLGEGLSASGAIAEAAADRTISVLAEYLALAAESRVGQIVCVGTQCLREASNAADFVGRVHDELGLGIEVIPGEEEARLTFLGARSGLPVSMENVIVFDVGGGSTEFAFGRGTEMNKRLSLEVGAVRLTERFLAGGSQTDMAYRRLIEHLAFDALAALGPQDGLDAVVGVGGTLTTMAAVMLQLAAYDGRRVHGARLGLDEVNRQIALYLETPVPRRRQITGMEPDRADIILAGAAIVGVVMRKLGATEVVVSDRGLRHGLLEERFGTDG